MLRREATISASVNSAGATGELLCPGRDRNAEIGGGGKVQHVRTAADQRQQLELGQPLQQRAGELDALADRHHHIGVVQALDQLIEIARRLAIALDVVMADHRKAGKLVNDVLIVVGNYNFHGRSLPMSPITIKHRCRSMQPTGTP